MLIFVFRKINRVGDLEFYGCIAYGKLLVRFKPLNMFMFMSRLLCQLAPQYFLAAAYPGCILVTDLYIQDVYGLLIYISRMYTGY